MKVSTTFVLSFHTVVNFAIHSLAASTCYCKVGGNIWILGEIEKTFPCNPHLERAGPTQQILKALLAGKCYISSQILLTIGNFLFAPLIYGNYTFVTIFGVLWNFILLSLDFLANIYFGH
jgi:hypothetical protein